MGNGIRNIAKVILGRLALALAAVLPVACGSVTGVDEASEGIEAREQDREGAVIIRISLGSVAALAKKADTSVTLNTLHLTLTSPGCSTRTVNLPISGNINSGSLVLTAKVNGLNPLRNWKVKAFSRDLSDTVMHMDSTTFYVKPADTADVSMLIVPKYSILVARFVSTSNSVSGIEKLVLKVNGVVVDDTIFVSKQKIFDVKLSHKYVKAGASTTLLLQAMDKASNNHVKYSKSLTFTPRVSGDSTITVQLH